MPRCTLHESDTHRQAFLALVEVAKESDDPNTQNAAGILDPFPPQKDWPFFCAFANDVPFRIDPTPERLNAPSKYDWIVHAEIGAMLAANGRSMFGTMYALWAACPTCALAIVQGGVSRLVTLRATQYATPKRWAAKVDKGLEILRAAGVTVSFFDGVLDTSILFDGKELRL